MWSFWKIASAWILPRLASIRPRSIRSISSQHSLANALLPNPLLVCVRYEPQHRVNPEWLEQLILMDDVMMAVRDAAFPALVIKNVANRLPGLSPQAP
ncbi:hypothetical protein SBA1_90010 [Candidatus Sulfotelmatobacter kueseliae]|uniref:Uncharacterized protein n=1 Tax=Candidatus Sulfotelmatobacter kueseliae TaxID=2042962 RepID=A0A2U3LAA5_9BACT|nr:hypothetical protein SBA1_90010 [Candidatus Sulfotelmatobacter kueseliae]